MSAQLLYRRLGRLAGRCQSASLVLVLGGLTGAAVAQIVVRNVLGIGLLWTEPLMRVLVLWGGLLGAQVAARDGQHVRLEVAARFCPARGRRWLAGAAALIACGVCGLLAGIGARFVRDEYLHGGPALLGLASWQVQLIFPLAFAGMAVHYLAHGLRSWRG